MADTTTVLRQSTTGRVRVQGLALRRWVATTPGRLRVASVVLAVVVIATATVGVVAAARRASATDTVAHQATPALIAAENLYGALADADAMATTTYLNGGVETAALRRRYDADIAAAGTQLAAVTRDSNGSTEVVGALHTLAQGIPTYAGLVESARANNLQHFSVGTAYLNQSSALMRDALLPAATVVYRNSAGQLDDAYAAGTSETDVVVVVVFGVLALGLLGAAQLYLTRRTHRVLNVGLVAATAIVIVMIGWTVGQFGMEQSALHDAQQYGSDAVQVLSAARIDALRARSDDNLALIARGTGSAFYSDFTSLHLDLTHLLGDARSVEARSGKVASVDTVDRLLQRLETDHQVVQRDDTAAQYAAAVSEATQVEATTSAQIDRALRADIAAGQAKLEQHTADAHQGFTALIAALVVLGLAGAGAVVLGLQPRIGEYR